jgi:hypothetical protein
MDFFIPGGNFLPDREAPIRFCQPDVHRVERTDDFRCCVLYLASQSPWVLATKSGVNPKQINWDAPGGSNCDIGHGIVKSVFLLVESPAVRAGANRSNSIFSLVLLQQFLFRAALYEIEVQPEGWEDQQNHPSPRRPTQGSL